MSLIASIPNAVLLSELTILLIKKDTHYEIFEKNIPCGGKILDLGCGSGRDSKYFIENGYHVTAIDGSAEMCMRTSKYLGFPVLNMKIEENMEIVNE